MGLLLLAALVAAVIAFVVLIGGVGRRKDARGGAPDLRGGRSRDDDGEP